MKHPVVLKFGGSSVGTPGRFENVVEVINRRMKDKMPMLVIASALSGVTNRLVELCEPGLKRDRREAIANWLFSRHRLHASEVLSLRSQRHYASFLEEFLANLEVVSFEVEKEGDPSQSDILLAAGERLSAQLLALALEDIGLAGFVKDAAGLIKTDSTFGNAAVDFKETQLQINDWYRTVDSNCVPVVTGFIGGTRDGRTTTLGRGGSDYSAALVAASLKALRLERWTDVDGVYTSDPRLDKQALRYDEIVLEDAVAWNRAGKLGMHRKALDPLVEAKIPVFVRSIDHPDWPGTVIRPKCHKLAATG